VRSVLEQSRRVILVAHDEKFGQRAPHVVTRMSQIDVLITNGDPRPRFDDAAALKDVRIISVD
jgi:DeoR family glycerol-3-phosphate regulon repressor